MVFLGDYVDRGPEVALTLETVRSMIDADNALAIMGNHEFNAVCFHTPDGKGITCAHTMRVMKKTSGNISLLLISFLIMNGMNGLIGLGLFLILIVAIGELFTPLGILILLKSLGDNLWDEDFLYQSSIPMSWQFSAVENVLKGLEVSYPTV